MHETVSDVADASHILSESTRPGPRAHLPARAANAPPAGTALGSHYSYCYGCGEEHSSGLHMQVRLQQGLTLTARFVVSVDHQGAPGLAHGGLLAAACDEALGASNWLLMTPAVTARLEVDFRRPVPVGSTLHFTARIIGQDGRKVYCTGEGRLDAPDGPIATTAAGLFLQVTTEHFIDNGRPDDVHAAASAGRSKERPWLEINP